MALIDEYKQAIQDVLDGRAKPAPKPSELPWTEDRAATMWAAAAAELIAEANAGGGSSGGGVLYVTVNQDTMTLSKNLEEIQTALDGGKVVMLKIESPSDGVLFWPLMQTASLPEDQYYGAGFYSFLMQAEMTFSNTTGPTDPLVYESEP